MRKKLRTPTPVPRRWVPALGHTLLPPKPTNTPFSVHGPLRPLCRGNIPRSGSRSQAPERTFFPSLGFPPALAPTRGSSDWVLHEVVPSLDPRSQLCQPRGPTARGARGRRPRGDHCATWGLDGTDRGVPWATTGRPGGRAGPAEE